jgi:hypothetical protein
MTGRLVYEVRLRKSKRKNQPWRWDVSYLLTTDPEFPGVETGRSHIGSNFGYTRFKWQAKKKIADKLISNPYQKVFTEQ